MRTYPDVIVVIVIVKIVVVVMVVVIVLVIVGVVVIVVVISVGLVRASGTLPFPSLLPRPMDFTGLQEGEESRLPVSHYRRKKESKKSSKIGFSSNKMMEIEKSSKLDLELSFK